MKKRTLALLLTVTLLSGLTACSGGGSDASASQDGSESQSVSSSEEETTQEESSAQHSASVGDISVDPPADASVGDDSTQESGGSGSSQPAQEEPSSSDELCGYPPAQNSSQSAAQEPVMTAPEPDPVQEEPDPQPEPVPATADSARAYIGQSVSSLIAAIGSPISSSYAPSCLGPGEDGELIYDGFTVYTYRENGTETVEDVL